MLTNMNAQRTEFQDRVDAVKCYMRLCYCLLLLYYSLLLRYYSLLLSTAPLLLCACSMLTNMNAQRTEFQDRVDAVKRYMRVRHVDRSLEQRILKWFDYMWTNNQSLGGEACLTALPSKLRAEIAISVHMEALKRVAIFKV